MAGSGSKTLVTIDKVSVAKCWDKTAKKSVIDAAQKVLEKALGRASGMKFVKSIKKTDKGLGVSLNFVDVAYNAKKSTLTLKLEVLVSKYPGPRMATTGGSPAKIEANKVNEKSALKQASWLSNDLVDAKMSKLIKVLQALAKSL